MSTEKAYSIKALFAAAIAFLTALWGWLGWAVFILTMAMLTDYVSGSAAARKMGEWSSAVAREGLWHKLGIVIAIGVAAFADVGVQVALMSEAMVPVLRGADWPHGFTLVVTLWYLFTELGSILENAGKLGARIPPWLAKGIVVLKTNILPEEDDQDDASNSGAGNDSAK